MDSGRFLGLLLHVLLFLLLMEQIYIWCTVFQCDIPDFIQLNCIGKHKLTIEANKRCLMSDIDFLNPWTCKFICIVCN